MFRLVHTLLLNLWVESSVPIFPLSGICGENEERLYYPDQDTKPIHLPLQPQDPIRARVG